MTDRLAEIKRDVDELEKSYQDAMPRRGKQAQYKDNPYVVSFRWLIAEVERLRQRLLSAAGDDLCRLTQEEIKQMSAGVVKIPPKEEFLASCERFHAQIASESGVMPNCLTLAQLIAENERLRGDTERFCYERLALQSEVTLLRESCEIGENMLQRACDIHEKDCNALQADAERWRKVLEHADYILWDDGSATKKGFNGDRDEFTAAVDAARKAT